MSCLKASGSVTMIARTAAAQSNTVYAATYIHDFGQTNEEEDVCVVQAALAKPLCMRSAGVEAAS